jgi:magnesium transporter
MKRTRNHAGQRLGRAIGGALGGILDVAVVGVEEAGRILLQPLHPAGLGKRDQERPLTPGAHPGIESSPNIHTPPAPAAIKISCIDYGTDQARYFEALDIDSLLAAPQPDWAAVRWINIDGVHPYVINRVREKFNFHTLAAEDALHIPQRPKLDPYDNHLFFVGRMLRVIDDHLVGEQISFFLAPGLLVTFQESVGDVWQPIRDRLSTPTSAMRKLDVSWLAYSLLDAMIDHCFPILERYGDVLEAMELEAIDKPTPDLLHRIHTVQRELAALRRVMWPTRELVQHLQSEELELISANTRTYLRDVYEHTVQIIDIIETFREMTASLADLYLSSLSNRMNEIMKVLTIIATLFIPATFLAGVYGMNFQHFPELSWQWGYGLFWLVTLSMMVGLLAYFRRKGWL